MGLFSKDPPHFEHKIYKNLEKIHEKLKRGKHASIRHLLFDLQELQDSETLRINSLKEKARENIRVKGNNPHWGSPSTWGENVRIVEDCLDNIMSAKQKLVTSLWKDQNQERLLDRFLTLTKHLYIIFRKMEHERNYITYRTFEKQILDPLKTASRLAKHAIKTAKI